MSTLKIAIALLISLVVSGCTFRYVQSGNTGYATPEQQAQQQQPPMGIEVRDGVVYQGPGLSPPGTYPYGRGRLLAPMFGQRPPCSVYPPDCCVCCTQPAVAPAPAPAPVVAEPPKEDPRVKELAEENARLREKLDQDFRQKMKK